MDVDDDLSSESSGVSEDFSVEASQIDVYQENVRKNQMDYDSHVNLIKGLHYLKKLEDAGKARKSMNEFYPLSPELWLQWTRDEIELGSNHDIIHDLFQKGVSEYKSVALWNAYLEFLIEIDEDVTKFREIYDRALSDVGTNPKNGSETWKLIIFYEQNFRLNLDSALIEEHDKLLVKLYRRFFSLPLLGSDEIETEFKTWATQTGFSTVEIEKGYEKVKEILQKDIKPFELRLQSATLDYGSRESKESIWLEYLERYETKFEKSAILSAYESAVTDVCLSSGVWCGYLRFVERFFDNEEDRVVATYRRAVLNCRHSLTLWLGLVRQLERWNHPAEDIRETFKSIFQQNLADSDPFVPLWLAYLDFEKRLLDAQVRDSKNQSGFVPKMDTIRELFERLLGLDNYLDYDPQCVLVKYWAHIEARFAGNLIKSRELWSLILKSLGKHTAAVILENLEFERRYGDFEHVKRLANNALNGVCGTDYPQFLLERILRIVAEDADLDSCLQFAKKADIARHKLAAVAVETARAKQQPERHLKRPAQDNSPVKSKRVKFAVEEKPKVEQTLTIEPATAATKPNYDDEKTLFVSNLDFKVTELQLRENFSTFGELADVRIIKDSGGKSRGYAYVQFVEKDACEKGLALERTQLMSRPMFVAHSNPSKRHKFEYVVDQVEKNKLFVKNLPRLVTQQALEEIFGKTSGLVAVRIPTFKTGEARQIAYVEFQDANCASKALVATDGLQVGDNKIQVLISRPPTRQTNPAQKPLRSTDNLEKKQETAPRPMMAPRKVIHQRNAADSTASTSAGSQPKSNDDFRQFLKK